MKSTYILASALLFAASVLADGSTITVSTTQFNPAETNQGGTTNSAGTFNVSPLATSSSYQFQTLSQTSTFVPGSVQTRSAQGGGGGGSGSGSGNSGNGSGGTIFVTSTASQTSTVNGFGSGSSSSNNGAGIGTSTGVATASNGLPSLSFGTVNAATAGKGLEGIKLAVGAAAVLVATMYGAFVIA